MYFTFLPGSAVGGIDQTTKFYAWASVGEDGQVVAWDYAPDARWLIPEDDLRLAPRGRQVGRTAVAAQGHRPPIAGWGQPE
jgi:hypothetical protein